MVQLYLSFPDVKGAPLRALRGFQRVHLEPGSSQAVQFELKPRDLSMVTEAGEPIIAEGQYKISIGGGQPGTGAPAVAGTFSVKGTADLAGVMHLGLHVMASIGVLFRVHEIAPLLINQCSTSY